MCSSDLGREPTDAVARRHALTLVPIAIAYHLAHYLSYLLVQGQAIVPLLSDPLGRGWNLFGTRDFQPDLNIVGPRFVWIAAVMAIVLGHVASVVLAHRASLRAGAAHGQWPIAALMVAYTMLSLWILAQPIVSL